MAIRSQIIQLKPNGVLMNIHIILDLLSALVIHVRSKLHRRQLRQRRGRGAPPADLGGIIGAVVVLAHHIHGPRVVAGEIVTVVVGRRKRRGRRGVSGRRGRRGVRVLLLGVVGGRVRGVGGESIARTIAAWRRR